MGFVWLRGCGLSQLLRGAEGENLRVELPLRARLGSTPLGPVLGVLNSVSVGNFVGKI